MRACPFSKAASRVSKRVYMFQPSVIEVMPIAASIAPAPMIAQNSALRPPFPAGMSAAMSLPFPGFSSASHRTPVGQDRQYTPGTDAAGNHRQDVHFLDVDGSVVSTGLGVEGARRGFNPHRRKVPSHYPITAHEANTGQALRACSRAGNVHEGKASLAFLQEQLILESQAGRPATFRIVEGPGPAGFPVVVLLCFPDGIAARLADVGLELAVGCGL